MTTSRGLRNRMLADYVELIPEAIRQGLGRISAAGLHGLAPSTMYEWIRKGKEDMETHRNMPQTECGKLYQAILHAEAEWELERLRQVREADYREAKKDQWLLERRLPRKWSNGVRERTGDEAEEENLHGLQGMPLAELERLAASEE